MRAARATPLGMLAIAATRLGAQPAAPPPPPSRGAPVLAASRGATARVHVSGGTLVPTAPLARVEGVAHVVVGDAYVVVADAPLLTELPLAAPRCTPGRCAIGAVRVFANRDWALEVSLAPLAGDSAGRGPVVALVAADGSAETPLPPGEWTPLATAATPSAGASAMVWVHLRDATGAPVAPAAVGAVGARLRFRLVPPAGAPPPAGR